MIKKILLVLLIAAAGFAAAASFQPDEFSVTRKAVMNVPAAAVFPHVNNLKKWSVWSPWSKMDPQSKSQFSGPDEGAGAEMRWEGNRDVGVGTMTITESVPYEKIGIKLVFEKPFRSESRALFTFRETGAGWTEVSWTMSGKNNFIGKMVSLLMNCDKMVGAQFEKGLESMRTAAEGAVSAV